MATPPAQASTLVTCPTCRRRFPAQIQQIFDTNQDPAAKSQFLRWRPAVARCPNCGYNGTLATPLIYHDGNKDLLMVYVPLELGLRKDEQERMIGELTNKVINALPLEKRRGYLLQPRMALSYQGIVDTIMSADGITPEMIKEQRTRIELIDRLVRASEAELPTLVAENDARLDAAFFQMLTASIEAAAQDGQQAAAQQLLAMRDRVLPFTSIGKRAQRQGEAIQRLQQAAQNGGITLDVLLEHLLAAVDDDPVLEALCSAVHSALDYNFFMALAERIGQAEGRSDSAQGEKLKSLREKVLAIKNELDRRNRAMLERAAQTLRALVQAPDLAVALQEHAEEIDDAFMAVLEANLQAMQQQGQTQTANRLQEIHDTIMSMMQSEAPPELQLINEMLSVTNQSEMEQFVQEKGAALTPELLGMMADIGDRMRESGRPEIADRLDQLRGMLGNIMARV